MIGGSIFDIVTSVSEPEIHSDGRTHPGSVSFGLGGVGRNLADALACFDDDPVFISAVGDDEQVKKCKVQCSCSGWPTGNGKKLSNCQACSLAQLCLSPA